MTTKESKSDGHHACCVARPGDTLIVGLATRATAKTVQSIAAEIKAGLPDSVGVCVVDNIAAIQVVRGGEN